MSKKKSLQEFKNEVFEVFGSNVEVLGEYKSNKEKILVRYNECGHLNKKTPSKLLSGQGCGICKGRSISMAKTQTTDQYKKRLVDSGITYIDVIGEYEGITEKVKVRNRKCGHIYEARAGNVLRGSGCPICYGMKDTKIFTEIIESKYPGEYEIIGEYVNNRVPIMVRHKCGHTWNVIPKDLMRAVRCPSCISSKGELFIKDYLIKNKIEFEQEYSHNGCRDVYPLPFDFMITVYGEMRLIEFDGSQHFKNAKSIYRNDKTEKHDEIKTNFCKENNIKLLRIPYWWLRTEKIEKELDKFCFNK